MANYIFFDGRLEKRAGGPSTYLYNLRNALIKDNYKTIDFIYDDSKKNGNEKNAKEKIKKILKLSPRLYERIYMARRKKKDNLFNVLKDKIRPGDTVMFHMTSDLAKTLNDLPKDCTKVLMSHSPEVASKQMAADLVAKFKSKKYNFSYTEKKYFKDFDLVAFKNADILVFPSKDSMEPYFQTCENFEKLISGKTIKYLPTGTEKLEYSLSKEEFRKKYNIPADAFVITFIGRHNEVKGYHDFVEICNKLLDQYKDIYVVTAGLGSIESPNNMRWIDIGWTNDPGSVANASDIFILPNKRTYFDLVLIEMISIGKTCIVSNTGGNRSMAEYSEGIIKYNNTDEAISNIKRIYHNRELLKEYERINYDTYNKYFTVEKFADRYVKLMEEIENEKK